VAVLGNAVIGGALVSAEGSNELAGTEVKAVVLSTHEKTVVPRKGSEVLVPVVNDFHCFENSCRAGEGLKISVERGGVHTNFVLEHEEVLGNVSVESGDHRDLRNGGHGLHLGVLGQLSLAILVKFEVACGVYNRGHHGTGSVRASGNAGILPAGVEQQFP